MSSAPPVAPPPAPEVHQHTGLFIHVDIPVGYLRTRGSKGSSAFESKGAALGVAFAIGWAPDDAWAVAAEYWGWKAFSASGLGSNTSLEVQAVGLNVTRYLEPVDVFASVVISGTRLAITDDYDEYASSEIGFGLKILLGKEWRLEPSLGIGVAGELILSLNRSAGQSLDTLGGGLVFSLTYR